MKPKGHLKLISMRRAHGPIGGRDSARLKVLRIKFDFIYFNFFLNSSSSLIFQSFFL